MATSTSRAAGRTAGDDELEIVRRRVLTQVSGAVRGGAPLKTLAARWLAFAEAVQHGSLPAAEDAHQRLLLALTDVQLLVSVHVTPVAA